MKRILTFCMALLCTQAAFAADYDGSKPLLCSSVTVNECLPNGACEHVMASAINAPDFFRIDVKKKNVAGAKAGKDRPKNKIDSAKVLGDKLYVQGKDNGVEGVRDDGLAWSVSIDQASGDMVLTASGDEVAFVIFGSCIVL